MYTGDISRLEDHLFELERKLGARQQESHDLANIALDITSIHNIEAVLAAARTSPVRQ